VLPLQSVVGFSTLKDRGFMQTERQEIIEAIRVRLRTYRDSLLRRLGGHWRSEDELRAAAQDDSVDVPAIHELLRTEAALDDIREGNYGLCGVCGSEIAGERLEVVPFAMVCVRCQLAKHMRRSPDQN